MTDKNFIFYIQKMLCHSLKVAFRNHSKHKIQSIISLLSLAVAFTCVSLATYWSHYEQTYDSFLPNYERIYKVSYKRPGVAHPENRTSSALITHLIENYPEVDKACGIYKYGSSIGYVVEVNEQTFPQECFSITPEAVDIMDIQWVEGNENVGSWKENEVAISEQMAHEICGKNSPLGLNLSFKRERGEGEEDEFQIVAVFKTRSEHSNFKFNILKRLVEKNSRWQSTLCQTYVRLHPKADPEQFLLKLIADTLQNVPSVYSTYNVLTPLKKVHSTSYADVLFQKKQNVRLNDVKLFAGAAILLAVCALVNYLTLFISRLRNRGRDMALRTICGSSSLQMGILLMVEYLLLLLGALVFSMIFIEVVLRDFVELAQIEIQRSTVYVGCGYLLLFIFGLATILSLVPILYFKQKTLRVQIEAEPASLGKNRFRIAGVCVQLFISMLFIFCATVMIKQMHYLIHADINIERKNIASLSVGGMKADQIMDNLRQLPMITDIVPVVTPLYPTNAYLGRTEISGYEGNENIVIHAAVFYITPEVARFYGLSMKDGNENFELGNYNECFINETFAKQLEDSNPVGKIFVRGGLVIKGVIHDFCYQPPTEPDKPAVFRKSHTNTNYIAFKYTGDFAACKAAIKKAFEEKSIYLDDGETVYKSYVESELNLLKLLNIITLISVLIALFGVYALILQECERQRKNIAIRKVYGAQVKDILMMFFKEYMLQVVIAATLAFPIGYALMKRWLEGYSRQTSIGIEVFLGIFIGMAFLVMLCIGWHVWRAANENPATAVKKE